MECIGKSVRVDSPAAAIVLNARDITERKDADERIEKLAVTPMKITAVASNGPIRERALLIAEASPELRDGTEVIEVG